eukprot:1789-Pelagococcus_subviridis.AAC.1
MAATSTSPPVGESVETRAATSPRWCGAEELSSAAAPGRVLGAGTGATTAAASSAGGGSR